MVTVVVLLRHIRTDSIVSEYVDPEQLPALMLIFRERLFGRGDDGDLL